MIKLKRTGLYIYDERDLNWANFRAKDLGYESMSEYLWSLVKLDREKDIAVEKGD